MKHLITVSLVMMTFFTNGLTRHVDKRELLDEPQTNADGSPIVRKFPETTTIAPTNISDSTKVNGEEPAARMFAPDSAAPAANISDSTPAIGEEPAARMFAPDSAAPAADSSDSTPANGEEPAARMFITDTQMSEDEPSNRKFDATPVKVQEVSSKSPNITDVESENDKEPAARMLSTDSASVSDNEPAARKLGEESPNNTDYDDDSEEDPIVRYYVVENPHLRNIVQHIRDHSRASNIADDLDDDPVVRKYVMEYPQLREVVQHVKDHPRASTITDSADSVQESQNSADSVKGDDVANNPIPRTFEDWSAAAPVNTDDLENDPNVRKFIEETPHLREFMKRVHSESQNISDSTAINPDGLSGDEDQNPVVREFLMNPVSQNIEDSAPPVNANAVDNPRVRDFLMTARTKLLASKRHPTSDSSPGMRSMQNPSSSSAPAKGLYVAENPHVRNFLKNVRQAANDVINEPTIY